VGLITQNRRPVFDHLCQNSHDLFVSGIVSIGSLTAFPIAGGDRVLSDCGQNGDFSPESFWSWE